MRSLIAAAALVVLGCSHGGAAAPAEPSAPKVERRAAPKPLANVEPTGLVIGEFPLATKRAIVDGDTIHVEGLDASLRLLGIDTEETFKHRAERDAYDAGWDDYIKDQRGNSKRPVKMATPLGDEAKKFAEHFFEGVTTVRLERDHPKEVRDYYNRWLAYVIVVKDGNELNYNVECVRAGYAPYFSKYGYSRRFHAEFVAAETEARAAHRGIWDPAKQHYPDYEERKLWWDARAEFIKRFESDAVDRDNFVELTNIDVPERLETLVGKEIVLLGVVGEIKENEKGPTLVMLARRRTSDFPLVFFDKGVFAASHLAQHPGEYVRARGVVSRYEGHGRPQLQIKITAPSQIVTQ